MKLIILASAMVLSSCGSICAPVKLPLPPKQEYPKIQATEIACLSDATYKKLNKRREMCEGRIETLQDIIKTTH